MQHLTAVGLDSAESGNPPSNFVNVYRRAGDGASRCGACRRGGSSRLHGRRSTCSGAADRSRGARAEDGVSSSGWWRADPLTVCPFSTSGSGLRSLPQHDLPVLVQRGLLVTVNSDDPAYFGGYVADNLAAVAETFDLGRQAVAQLARNSFRASFLPDPVKEGFIAEVDRSL